MVNLIEYSPIVVFYSLELIASHIKQYKSIIIDDLLVIRSP